MTAKAVVPRERARQDIEAAIAHYEAEGGEALALGFIEALRRAFARIGRHPGIGSARYGQELRLEGLRAWPLRQFPYRVFYRDDGAAIDVWRVLHARRDIPAWMQAE